MSRPIALSTWLAAALLIVVGVSIAAAREPVAGNKFATSLKFQITAPQGTSLVLLNVVLPKTVAGRQRIDSLQYSSKPAETHEKEGQLYGQFVFRDPPESLDFSIDIQGEVYRDDLTVARRKPRERTLEKPDSLKQWLIDEPYLERQNGAIQKVAQSLIGKTDDEKARACLNYVVKNLRKSPFDDEDHGAIWALQRRQGDCTEFADLFITLCRAKGVPARYCEGYLLGPVTDTPKHAWAEVYLEKSGWIPVDPLYIQHGQATLAELPPIYLLLDRHRRNGVLQNHHYWSYRYEGKDPIKIEQQFSVTQFQPLTAKKP